MRTAFAIVAALAFTAVAGLAHAQDCVTAGAPTCDGTCPIASICVEDPGGLGCSCVAGTALEVTKLQIKLSFSKTDNDKIGLKALIPAAADFDPTGKAVVVDIGGVVKSFTLDAKGKGETADGLSKIKISRPKDGVAKFSAKSSKGQFASSLTDEGLVDATVEDVPVEIAVDVTVGTDRLKKVEPKSYTAKQGSSGKTK